MANNVFWDKSRLDAAGATPTILAIGDSWFWYPLIGGSLINPLGELVASNGHVIYAVGNNGAEAIDYTQGRYKRQVNEAIRLFGDGLSAVFISGGGNDVAGRDDLLPMLKTDCSGETTAAGCFRSGAGTGTLDEMIARVGGATQKLVDQLLAKLPAVARIYLHCYEYGYPDGRHLPGGSAWMKPALDEALVPARLQRPCAGLVIDRFAVTFDAIAQASAGRVCMIDSRGTLTRSSQWANELHPTPAGFKRIANQAWYPELKRDGLAK